MVEHWSKSHTQSQLTYRILRSQFLLKRDSAPLSNPVVFGIPKQMPKATSTWKGSQEGALCPARSGLIEVTIQSEIRPAHTGFLASTPSPLSSSMSSSQANVCRMSQVICYPKSVLIFSN